MTAGRPPGDQTSGDRSVTRRTLTGFVWMISGSGVQAVLRIASVVVLARLLTPEEFGVMGAALVVTGLSSMFSQLGMGPALVQRSDLESRHLRTAMTVMVLVSLLLAASVALAAPAIAGLFGFDSLVDVLRVVSLLFPINGLSVVAISLLQRELKFKVVALIGAASYAVGYVVVGVILAALGFGVWALVYAHLTRATIKTVALLVAQPHPKRPQIEFRALSELVRFGGGVTIARIFNYTANQGDYVVAGRWLGAAALGVYTRAYQLLVFPVNLFASVLDDVLFPAMARVQSDTKRLGLAYRRGEATIALVFLPLSVFATILAPEIVLIALGDQWSEVIAPFQILTLGMFFRAGYKISNSVSRAVGAVYRQAWRQAVFASAVVLGSWVGQKYAGLEGLAFGVLGALLINFVMMNRLSLSLVGISWGAFLRSHSGGVRAALLTGAVVAATAGPLRALEAHSALVFAASGLATLLALGLAAQFIRGFMDTDGVWLVDTIKDLVRNRWGRRRATRLAG